MTKRFFLAVLAAGLAAVLTAATCMGACDCGNAKDPGKTPTVGLCNNDAWKKLGRGACNILTFSFEIPNQISKTNDSDGPMAAFTWGLLKGAGMSAFRALAGVYEVVSFPMPYPEGYKPILTDPEFFLEGQIA